jgi:hypothetical protein
MALARLSETRQIFDRPPNFERVLYAYEARMAGRGRVVPFQDMRSRSSAAGGPMEKLYLVLLGIALLITLAWIAFLLYGAYYLPSV